MDNVFILIFVLLLMLIIFLFLIYKYALRPNFTFKKLIKETSILFKVIYIILILYMISIPIQSFLYIKNISYNHQDVASRYNDIVDVNDGVVAVGWENKSLSIGNHIYCMARASIKKYTYDGKILWENIYYVDVKRSTEFLNVEVDQNGNYLVSGTDDNKTNLFVIYKPNGELVDQKIIDEANYSRVLSDGTILNAFYDSRTFDSGLNINLTNTNKEKLSEYQYNYHHPIETYNDFYRVKLVGESENHIFLTLETLQINYVFLEVRLFVFNRNLQLIDEYIYTGDYSIIKVIEDNQRYYIAWNNENKRTCFYGEYSKSMKLIQKRDIIGRTSYANLTDMLYIDNNLYIFGNEYYQEQDKYKNPNNYSGFMITGNIYNGFKYYSLGKGVEAKSSLISNDKLYSAGMFDSQSVFLSNSAYYNNSNKGIITIYDLINNKIKKKIFMT